MSPTDREAWEKNRCVSVCAREREGECVCEYVRVREEGRVKE